MIRTLLVSMALGFTALSLTSAPKAEANACYAYTACPYSGLVIQCETFGGPFAACGFNTVPGWSVQCIGYDAWGQWVNLFFHC